MSNEGIDRSAPEEFYRQLAELLMAQIEDGRLPPRTKLPTQQALVETYDVSRGTVLRATEVLVTEGLARFVKGKGLFTEEPGKIEAWKRERAAARKKR